MSLSHEAVKALLAAPKRKKKGKAGPDTNVRDIATWFALAPKTRSEVEQGNAVDMKCDNPNCVDPRPGQISALTGKTIKHQFVVDINGQHVCRYCFLDGWLLENPDQATLPT